MTTTQRSIPPKSLRTWYEVEGIYGKLGPHLSRSVWRQRCALQVLMHGVYITPCSGRNQLDKLLYKQDT